MDRRAMVGLTLAGTMFAPRAQAKAHFDVAQLQTQECPTRRGMVGRAEWTSIISEIDGQPNQTILVNDSFKFQGLMTERKTNWSDETITVSVDFVMRLEYSPNRMRFYITANSKGYAEKSYAQVISETSVVFNQGTMLKFGSVGSVGRGEKKWDDIHSTIFSGQNFRVNLIAGEFRQSYSTQNSFPDAGPALNRAKREMASIMTSYNLRQCSAR